MDRCSLLTGTATVAALAPLGAAARQPAAAPPADPRRPALAEVTVNGQRHSLPLDNRTTLLDTLRMHLGLTGSKKGYSPALTLPTIWLPNVHGNRL